MVLHSIYKEVWTPFVGELLVLRREPNNPEHPWAVAIASRVKDIADSLHASGLLYIADRLSLLYHAIYVAMSKLNDSRVLQ